MFQPLSWDAYLHSPVQQKPERIPKARSPKLIRDQGNKHALLRAVPTRPSLTLLWSRDVNRARRVQVKSFKVCVTSVWTDFGSGLFQVRLSSNQSSFKLLRAELIRFGYRLIRFGYRFGYGYRFILVASLGSFVLGHCMTTWKLSITLEKITSSGSRTQSRQLIYRWAISRSLTSIARSVTS